MQKRPRKDNRRERTKVPGERGCKERKGGKEGADKTFGLIPVTRRTGLGNVHSLGVARVHACLCL